MFQKSLLHCSASTHYGRSNIPRVPRASPSAKNWALGEELHSGKMAFPECLKGQSTRGTKAIGEGHLPRAQHSGKKGTRQRKVAFDSANRRSRLKKIGKALPGVPRPSTRGRLPLPRVPCHSTRGNIYFFCFFCPNFL
jgi:hypothetical protein